MKMVSCAGCDLPIKDRYLDKILDVTWHIHCVICFDCKSSLTGKCYTRDGKLFCKQDFFKRFGTKCAGCDQGILPEDYVRWARNKVYHIPCFTCVDCHRELSTGDTLYILDDDRLLCKSDYLTSRHHSQALVKDELMQPDISMTPPDSMSMSQSDLSSVPTSTSERLTSDHLTPELQASAQPPSQQQQQHLQLDNTNHPYLSDSSTTTLVTTPNGDETVRHRRDSSVRSGHHHHNNNKSNSSSEHKPTRVRTVLNEKQLTTLRSCYNANPRPDALLKERLVDMTGLSARVIRVWFQNKRCKDKKKQIMMKQIQQQEKCIKLTFSQEHWSAIINSTSSWPSPSKEDSF
ncbi:LIM/homeobox protein Lhx5-like isoform X2 [Panonychus citri]|uniref:LIM/homeobox protein Lhx5-like isoform X2 n=1 Tax=Panonychus citri TaxID=50023 RepID=UPI0023080557|nr:LIM/homeobox protein Lhx5-like isoform X2 [Panonychus citri]